MPEEPKPEPKPETDIYQIEENGTIGVIIKRATVVEYEGELVPGMSFTPVQALEVAETLVKLARELLLVEAADK